jgi:hypothetical protein
LEPEIKMPNHTTEGYLADKLAGTLQKYIIGTAGHGIPVRFLYTKPIPGEQYLTFEEETFEEWKKRKEQE